jgi:hypothetical protein
VDCLKSIRSRGSFIKETAAFFAFTLFKGRSGLDRSMAISSLELFLMFIYFYQNKFNTDFIFSILKKSRSLQKIELNKNKSSIMTRQHLVEPTSKIIPANPFRLSFLTSKGSIWKIKNI